MKARDYPPYVLLVLLACAISIPAVALGQQPPEDGPAAAPASEGSAVPAPPTEGSAPQSDAGQSTSLLGDLQSQAAAIWKDNTFYNWISPPLGLVLGWLLGRILAAVLRWVGNRFKGRRWITQEYLLTGLAGPASLVLITVGTTVGLANFKMHADLREFWSRTAILLYTIAFLWYASNLVRLVELALRKLISRRESALDEYLAPWIRRILRVVLWTLGILFVVNTVFGQDIGAWLAGLGIAGLAVSLAAQDSLKNLFGSLTIMMDRPFRIGERIVYGGYDGVIEEIGFRSTKVRTLTGNLVTIPNANIVNEAVENIGRRPSIRRILNVTITYDTPVEKIRQAVQIVRDILEEPDLREPIHQSVDGEEFPPRVHFNDLNADSLNIFVIYWYIPPIWWDYMEHAEKVNFRIFEEYEKAGIEFAFPTQTLYLAGDPKRKLALEMLGADLQPPE